MVDPVETLARAFEAVGNLFHAMLHSFLKGETQLEEADAAMDEAAGHLKDQSQAWVEQTLPEVYGTGMHHALTALQTHEDALSEPALPVHDASLTLHQQDLSDALMAATDQMTRDAKATLRELARDKLAGALAQGANASAGAKELAQRIDDEGVAIIDRAGKRWNPYAYAKMVMRDGITDTLNEGNLNAGVEQGSTHVAVRDGKTTSDEPCQIANGQVWTLAYARTHMREHPNCRRSFAPLPADYAGKVDRGAS